jgi:hypothetical protein
MRHNSHPRAHGLTEEFGYKNKLNVIQYEKCITEGVPKSCGNMDEEVINSRQGSLNEPPRGGDTPGTRSNFRTGLEV